MDLDMKGMGGWFFILSNIYINKTWDWCVPDFPAGAFCRNELCPGFSIVDK